MRTAIAILMLVGSFAAAHAFGLGKEGKLFGRLGAISNKKGSAIGTTGKILLVDGTSFILQTDATSKICRAGGC
jgi:hypothetical protein